MQLFYTIKITEISTGVCRWIMDSFVLYWMICTPGDFEFQTFIRCNTKKEPTDNEEDRLLEVNSPAKF